MAKWIDATTKWIDGLSEQAATFFGSLTGALVGLLALLLGALFNAWLSRLRDGSLQRHEREAVLMALYGEILVLRRSLGRTAELVASIWQRRHDQARSLYDEHFLRNAELPQPTLYVELASKLGLIEKDIILPIVYFYSDFVEVQKWLRLIAESEGRDFSYSAAVVLRPANRAIEDVVPVLCRIEKTYRLAIVDKRLDLGTTHAVLDEELAYDEALKGKTGVEGRPPLGEHSA